MSTYRPIPEATHDTTVEAALRARIAELERAGDALSAAGNELYCLEHEDVEGCLQEESEDEPSTVICTCGMAAAEEQWKPAVVAWRKLRAEGGK